MLRKGITESFGAAIHGLGTAQLTDLVVQRSKRMMLDTLGVGLLGTRTAVFHKALAYSQLFTSEQRSSVWGRSEAVLPPHYAAFVNGVAVHSMDFDDTWHPATHPSGAVLPGLLALAETLPSRPSGLELLLAFNVGLEVQGRLMRFSREAGNIPERFHPPSVVGVMGSAAAAAKLLRLSPAQCAHALAIAASSAGAPLANAATQTKPLHVGNAARRGLEAAQLAALGLEGNPNILDLDSGLGVYYRDYRPCPMDGAAGSFRWVLEDQDVAFKRLPAHLAMHWAVDAALAARAALLDAEGGLDPGQVTRVTLQVPSSRYIDRPLPVSEHQARHSFQFCASAALLDGAVTPATFSREQRERRPLVELLGKVRVQTPRDNPPCFDGMYCSVELETARGGRYSARCDTFYGHWRRPLSQRHLLDKFRRNASAVLRTEGVEGVEAAVGALEDQSSCSTLGGYLRMSSHTPEQ
ncbi:cis-aconitate decarboxylase [Cololabis saira]|uniref:cis-aconitate decarboxylase n=1 Tax=Cololabis saira TaxID=129043 RepID=UPI002AD59E18|nr:cis-aconitate decarboxylase [Cololabis saira]